VAIEIELPAISEGAEEIISIDCRNMLDVPSNEKVASVVVPANEEGYWDEDGVFTTASTDLTLANEQASTTALSILNNTVPIGKAILLTVEGQQSGRTYRILVTPTSDKVAPIPRVFPFWIKLPCV
jgi:hypothetical protein